MKKVVGASKERKERIKEFRRRRLTRERVLLRGANPRGGREAK